MNTINIEGKDFTIEQLKELIKKNENLTELQKAINKLGEKDEEVIKFRKLEDLGDKDSLLAYQKLVVIIKFLNDGWKRNGKDTFYYIWFYLNPFRFYYVYYDCGNSYVPSALCFKNEKLAEFASTNEEILGYYKICF